MGVVTEEVKVIEEHALHATIVEQPGAPVANCVVVVLVQHLVRLDIQAPITCARVQSRVRHVSVCEMPTSLVPMGVDDADPGIVDRFDQATRVVVRVSGRDRDNQLVDDRQDR